MNSRDSWRNQPQLPVQRNRIEALLDNAFQVLKGINASLGVDPTDLATGLEQSMEGAVNTYIQQTETRLEDLRKKCEEEARSLENFKIVLSDVPIATPVENLDPPYFQLLGKLREARSLYISTWEKRLTRRNAAVATASVLYNQLQVCPENLLDEIEYEKKLEERGFDQSHETRPKSLSLEVICDLETSLDDMEKLKSKRLDLAKELTTEILQLWELLEIPEDDRQTSASDPDKWLNQERQQELLSIKNELEALKETRKLHISGLSARVEHLWNMLDIDPSERTVDVAGAVSKRPTQTLIMELEAELSRLEVQKREHMDRVICNMRSKIETLWTKLMFSDKEKYHEFAEVDSANGYTEESLEAHEREINRLETLLQDPKRRQIIARVHAYDDLCTMELELAEAAKDPERFKRRGTQLIEEGRKRSRVANQKPAVVRNLIKLLDEWVQQHDGEPLLIRGVDFAGELRENEQKILLGPGRTSSLTSESKNSASIPPSAAAAKAATAKAAAKAAIVGTKRASASRIARDRISKPRLVQHTSSRAVARPLVPRQPVQNVSTAPTRSQGSSVPAITTAKPESLKQSRPAPAVAARPPALRASNQETLSSTGSETAVRNGNAPKKITTISAPKASAAKAMELKATAARAMAARAIVPETTVAPKADAAELVAPKLAAPRSSQLKPPRRPTPKPPALRRAPLKATRTRASPEKEIPVAAASRAIAKNVKTHQLREASRTLAHGITRALQETSQLQPSKPRPNIRPNSPRKVKAPNVQNPSVGSGDMKENAPQPKEFTSTPLSPHTMFESWRAQEMQRLRSLRMSYGGGNDSTVSDLSRDAY